MFLRYSLKIVFTLILSLAMSIIFTNQSVNENYKASAEETKTLTLSHIHNDSSPVYQSLEEFSKKVEEKTNGSVEVNIFAEGVLGDEAKVIELVQNDVIDMVKVNGGVVEMFDEKFSTFSLPYIFKDDEHFHNFMETDTVEKMYKDLEKVQLRGITYYDAGARSFYTADRKIKTPEDLNGLKIRVMDNITSIETMEMLGASPTPLDATEVYTGLQQGTVDGAESSPIALVDSNHGEVAKQFSFDEHTRIPDFLLMSDSTWKNLNNAEQEAVMEAGEETTEEHNKRWNQMIEDAIEQAEAEMNVEFYNPDQEQFREKVQPLIEERRQDNEEVDQVLETIEALE